MATKRIKHLYLRGLIGLIVVLALVRWVFGISIQPQEAEPAATEVEADSADLTSLFNRVGGATRLLAPSVQKPDTQMLHSQLPFPPETRMKPYSAMSVKDYCDAFPDSNYVQLEAAHKWGVPPVKNRADAEQRKGEVVYMGSSPYYDMARLNASIPYLVPRASVLLQVIGQNFLDSLHAQGLPMNKMVVSSVLRSEEDVVRLRRSNRNATEQSCHLYGTTFDITYGVFNPMNGIEETTFERLKYVLGQVLWDLRRQGRCYVKYEVGQPCFHITVR